MSDTATRKKPNKFRWLIRGAIALVVLLIALVIAVGVIGKSYVTPDYIVSMIEAENNCRVQIDSTEVSLFSVPSKVEIKGLKIVPRDEHADAGTKLADRPPLTGGLLTANSITLEANLLDLLSKKISVKHLTIDELNVAELLIEDEGGPRTSKNGPKLDALFDPPVLVKGNENPEFEEKKRRRELAKERRKQEKENRTPAAEEEKFAISELPLPATMNALNIKNARLNAKIRRNKTRITFSNIQIKVSDIDVDPGDLAKHNKARVNISCHLDIEDRDRTIKYADLEIRSEGEVIPFDPLTGYINPDLIYKITILKGSKLDTIPSLVKLATKIKKLNEIGLKLDALADSITFAKDTSVSLGYREDALRFLEPTEIEFNGHLLRIKENAWLHTGSNQHEAMAEVLLSKEASDKALGNAEEFLAEKAKSYSFDKDLVLKYSRKLLEPVTKNGQVWVPFTSTGDLNDPKVRPDVDLQSLAETMALEALGDLLEKTQQDASNRNP